MTLGMRIFVSTSAKGMCKILNFYSIWKEILSLRIDDKSLISDYLKGTCQSLSPLINGTDEDQGVIFEILNRVPVISLLNVLSQQRTTQALTPAMIPCFSTFENGAIRIVELLEFSPSGMTLAELGYQMNKATKVGAQIKYGENHSKLSAMMSLVTITNTRPAKVTSTPWGRYLMKFSLDEKRDVLRKLLLRDTFIQQFIASTLNGKIQYRDITACLSDSTSYRRRTSVKCLMDFILKGTEVEEYLKNIIW